MDSHSVERRRSSGIAVKTTASPTGPGSLSVYVFISFHLAAGPFVLDRCDVPLSSFPLSSGAQTPRLRERSRRYPLLMRKQRDGRRRCRRLCFDPGSFVLLSVFLLSLEVSDFVCGYVEVRQMELPGRGCGEC